MRFIKISFVLGLLEVAVIPGSGAVPISPFLIGENSFNADVAGKDADRVWGKMKEARFRLIRLGGISNNDKTPSPESHARWIDSIRSIGAEPLVQVSGIDPPATAANLVRALNVDRKYGIRFWSIGNEQTCVEKTSPDRMAGIAANAKARALAMKAVDPSIKILFGDECYWKPDFYGPLIGGANDVTGNDANGIRYIDGITFHTYPLPGDGRNSPYTRNDVLYGALPNVRGQFQNCVKLAAAADSMHHRTGDARLSISITEFNVTYWNSSDNSPSGVGVRSFLAGQFVAEVFGMGMESGAFTVAPWSILESGGDGRAGDLGLFDGTGAIVPRPAYHHIKMIAGNMSGACIATSVEKAELIHTYATQDKDEAAVLILNENLATGFRCNIIFTSQGALAATGPTIHVDAGWGGEVTDTVPAQSTVLLKVRKPGVIATRTFYSLAMAEKYLPPTVEAVPVTTVNSPKVGEARKQGGMRVGRDEMLLGLEAAGPHMADLVDSKGRMVSWSISKGFRWVIPIPGLKPGG